ncbi:MAG: hypothetical protein U0457_11825 [Candidatus Sericytochromatia bacterium]
MNKKILKVLLSLSFPFVVASCPNYNQNCPEPPCYYNPDNPTGEGPSDLSKKAYNGVLPYVVMKNVRYRIHPEVAALVEDLFGHMIPNNITDPVNFDDPSSFTVRVHQAKLIMEGTQMNNLLKNFTLNYADAPLKDVVHTITAGNRISLAGKIKQAGIFVSFEMRGAVNATPDGLVKIEPDYIKTAGVPVKSLLDLFGLNTGKLITLDEKRGLRLEGNSIIIIPANLFPPPVMNGRVSRVETENDKLILHFDDGTKFERPALPTDDPSIKNYQHIYGGAVRIAGNETHENTNLLIADIDQSNPFDFMFIQYQNQLMAGYVRVLNKAGTLLTYMPDYADIAKRKDKKSSFSRVDEGLANEVLKLNPNSNPKSTMARDLATIPSSLKPNNGNGGWPFKPNN